MKIRIRNTRLGCAGKRAVLAALLCLPWCPAGADSTIPATENKIETVSPAPEGYRPLPVTEFVVMAEENGSYQIAVGVEHTAKATETDAWIKKILSEN